MKTNQRISEAKKYFGIVCALSLGVAACQPVVSQTMPKSSVSLFQAPRMPLQTSGLLQTQWVTASDLAPESLKRWHQQAQAYADDISRKRDLDYFDVFAQPVGLRLQAGTEQAWVLSFLGSSRERTDLNVELRLLAAQNSGLNLNYSGPVTLGRHLSLPEVSSSNPAPLAFELITGLPGNGVIERYSDFMDGLNAFLRQRFQAQGFEWDDAPLVYVLKRGEQPLAFVLLNQRNRLVLGERKYADLQSVVSIDTTGELTAYTVVGFNPKTETPANALAYQIENHAQWGHVAVVGTW